MIRLSTVVPAPGGSFETNASGTQGNSGTGQEACLSSAVQNVQLRFSRFKMPPTTSTLCRFCGSIREAAIPRSAQVPIQCGTCGAVLGPAARYRPTPLSVPRTCWIGSDPLGKWERRYLQDTGIHSRAESVTYTAANSPDAEVGSKPVPNPHRA